MAGPSHVLPTFGTARFASPLGVYDFQNAARSLVFLAKPPGPYLRQQTCLLGLKV